MLGISSAFPGFQALQGEGSPKTTALHRVRAFGRGPSGSFRTPWLYLRAEAAPGRLQHSPVLDGWLRCPHTLKHISLLNSLQYINFYWLLMAAWLSLRQLVQLLLISRVGEQWMFIYQWGTKQQPFFVVVANRFLRIQVPHWLCYWSFLAIKNPSGEKLGARKVKLKQCSGEISVSFGEWIRSECNFSATTDLF